MKIRTVRFCRDTMLWSMLTMSLSAWLGCAEKPPEPTPEAVQEELKQLDDARQREMSNQ